MIRTVKPIIGHRQLAILARIGVANARREPVTLREMADEMGVTLNAVSDALRGLIKYGLLTKVAGRARTLRVACRYIPMEGTK